MDPFGLIVFAISYVALQFFTILYFNGFWLRAAVVPIPLLCAILVLSVSAGLFGVNGAEIGATLAVPLGVIYLSTLVVFAQVARLLRLTPPKAR